MHLKDDGINEHLWFTLYVYVFQERMKKAEADIVNLEIPGELAYVFDKLDGKEIIHELAAQLVDHSIVCLIFIHHFSYWYVV